MLLSIALATTLSVGVGQDGFLSLYAGQALAGSGFTVAAWGGGTIAENKENAFRGGHSLLITSSGMYQGGTLSFREAVRVAEMASNPENMLSATLYVVGSAGTPGVASPRKNIERVRMLIRTSDGKLSEAFLPIGLNHNRWKSLGVPLNKIAGFSKTNMEISSVALGADAPGALYLGELRVVNDKTSIQGFTEKSSMQVSRDQETVFVGSAESGSTLVEFVWDFNAKDGLQEDAVGQAVFHRFRVPGEYTVTLTVRDKYGIKKPWHGTITVTVWE